MKNLFAIFMLVLAPFIAKSQIATQGFSSNGSQLELNLYQNSSVTIGEDTRAYKGSPFVNEDLVEGVITTGEGNQQVFYMRYNVLDERIEFSKNNDLTTLKALPKTKDLVILLDGKTYQYLNVGNLPSSYYEIIKAFDKDTLLLVKHSKRIQEVQNKSSYNSSQKSKLVSSDEIYFLSNEKAVEIDNHKRRSLNAFPESSQSELKDYIKEKKIRFSDDYKGLEAIISKYLAMK
jgi:hypothetical protein